MSLVKLRKEIQSLKKKLEILKSKCTHPKNMCLKKDEGSSGNWDPMDDRSWTRFTCTVCDHSWTEDHT